VVETRVIQPDSVVEHHPSHHCGKATSVANSSYQHDGNRDRMHISTIVQSVDRRRIGAISIVIAGVLAQSVS
jgi:hypothetical protein